MIYTTHENDVLDAICYQYYQQTETNPEQALDAHNTTEFILAINPHLAEYPAILPEGIKIELPELTLKRKPDATTYLWS